MASEREQFIKEIGKGFDEERKLLMPKNSWFALLAPGQDAPFRQLRYYTKAFMPRSNNFKTGFYVEIATLDDLSGDIQECTTFAIGDGTKPDGLCYQVSAGDPFPPSGDRLTWLIYGEFVPSDRYVPVI